MSKICKNCQQESDSNAKFCANCGSSEFIETPVAEEPVTPVDAPQAFVVNKEPQAPEQPVYRQPSVPQSEAPQQPDSQYYAPQYNAQPVTEAPKKKKLPGWAIALIVVGSILLVMFAGCLGCVGCVFCLGSRMDYTDDTSINFFTIPAEETESPYVYTDPNVTIDSYTKGEFNGTYYNNVWADIKYYLPVGFVNGDSDDYESFEDSVTDCVMYFISRDKTEIICMVVEKPEDSYLLDEEAYLDSVLESFEDDDEWIIDSNYRTEYVSGNTYTAADCIYIADDSFVVESFYVRNIGDRVLSVVAISGSSDTNQKLFNQIKNADR